MVLLDRAKLVKADSRIVTVNIATTSTTLIGGNANRIALTVVAPNATRVTISNRGPVVLGQGLTLYAADPPFTIRLAEHGGLLIGPLFAISDTGAQDVSVIETTLIE